MKNLSISRKGEKSLSFPILLILMPKVNLKTVHLVNYSFICFYSQIRVEKASSEDKNSWELSNLKQSLNNKNEKNLSEFYFWKRYLIFTHGRNHLKIFAGAYMRFSLSSTLAYGFFVLFFPPPYKHMDVIFFARGEFLEIFENPNFCSGF